MQIEREMVVIDRARLERFLDFWAMMTSVKVMNATAAL